MNKLLINFCFYFAGKIFLTSCHYFQNKPGTHSLNFFKLALKEEPKVTYCKGTWELWGQSKTQKLEGDVEGWGVEGRVVMTL